MICNMTPNSFIRGRTIQIFCGRLKTRTALFNAAQFRASTLASVCPPPPPLHIKLSRCGLRSLFLLAFFIVSAQAQAQSCATDEFRDGNECVKTCPTGKVTLDRRCVMPKEKCEERGWQSVISLSRCLVGHWDLASGSTGSQCTYSSGGNCYDAFGPNLEFPQRPEDGSDSRYVYNCDPDGTRGLIPATINTIGAIECRCAKPSHIRQGATRSSAPHGGLSPLVGGQCVFTGLRMRLRIFLEGPLR